MAQDSKIEWCHHTDNLWWGCEAVSPGCDHCYAEVLANRWGHEIWGNEMPRKLVTSAFRDLDRYQKMAAKAGENHLVFVGSMMDIAEKPMRVVDWVNGAQLYCLAQGTDMSISKTKEFDYAEMHTGHLRDKFFARISLGYYPNLVFLLLSKRPSNFVKCIPEPWIDNPPENVVYGTSPVDQKTFDTYVRQLLKLKGKKFLSIEPQIEGFSLGNLQGIDWIIQGGESGFHKRPFDLSWAYSIKEQCAQLGIPYFFKQIDKVQPIPEDLTVREFPRWYDKVRKGKFEVTT